MVPENGKFVKCLNCISKINAKSAFDVCDCSFNLGSKSSFFGKFSWTKNKTGSYKKKKTDVQKTKDIVQKWMSYGIRVRVRYD